MSPEQYNVVPMKDFDFSKDKTPTVAQPSPVSKIRAATEKVTYLESMKMKAKLNKQIYKEEFRDLDTKKETEYTNYLHE